MNDEVERAVEAIEHSVPGSGASDMSGIMWATNWKPRQLSLRRKLWERIKWRYISPRIEPILRRLAGTFDWYLET